MKYEINLSKRFRKEFKRLFKKYHSLDNDLERLINSLEQNPAQGADLGNNLRKVRMAISAKGKGKSHGARVITCTALINVDEGTVTLLTLYDKAEQDSIGPKEIETLLAELKEDV